MQLKICYFLLFVILDYSNFDVILLYILICNLCLLLELIKGWGKDLVDVDIQIGDDIECFRIFRNNNVYNSLLEIFDIDFEIIWKKFKIVFKRIKKYMKFKGYNVNYEEKMINIKQFDFGDEFLYKYKIEYILEYILDSLK